MKLFAAATVVIGSAAAAAIAPVWTYAISLLLFGLPHVLVELRYVDERFAGRLPRRAILGFGACLIGIVLMRALGLFGVGGSSERITTELAIGVALILVALPLLRRTAAPPLATAIAVLLLGGILYAPVATLVIMALLHNLTPVGFLAERLRGRDRRRAMTACLVVFAAIPAALLLTPPSGTFLIGPLTIGHIDSHLPAFVPPALLGTELADRLFATAAYLQCMHYAVVLHVLPRLSGGAETAHATLPWPGRHVFAGLVAAIGLLTAIAFAVNFTGTRSVYALFAAVHAWIEIPVLLVACAVLPRNSQPIAVAT